ncbi:MAG: T9SS type A sorting domain-containing protein [Bacteroidetes bacterium]|nr:T9SS type A sorting domain-containing protein [Bacteroidota bacterium]
MKLLKYLLIPSLAFFGINTMQLSAQSNCDFPNTGLTPFLDLQTGYYLGYQAGLYPGGSNELTGPHLKSGKTIANGIKPLDGDGNINFGDGVVLVAGFGPSVPGHIYNKFVEHVRTPSDKYDLNPCLDALNLCVGGKDIGYATIDSTSDSYWESLVQKVYDVGYTPEQVQIGWMYFNSKGLTVPPIFPDKALETKALDIIFINKAKEHFPNLKIMYISSRHFGGYADTSIVEYYSLAEPTSYQNSWTVKWLVEEQINNTNPMLQYKGANPKAPYIMWGPNFWCDGDAKRDYDDKKYICELSYSASDGYHLSDQQDSKDALDILDVMYYGTVGKQFTKNSAVWENCIPWLDTLAGGLREKPEVATINNLTISPNPGYDEFYIGLPNENYPAEITILNELGQIVDKFYHEENFSTSVLIDMSGKPNGIYFAKVMMNNKISTLRFIKQG